MHREGRLRVDTAKLVSLRYAGGEKRGLTQLSAHEVITRRDATWHGESSNTLVGNHLVDSPRSKIGIESVLIDLEPLEAGHVRLQRGVDLGEVNHDWALMTGVDRVGWI